MGQFIYKPEELARIPDKQAGQTPVWNGTAWVGTSGTTNFTRFTHDQQVASTSWVITHNLGDYPPVTIVDSAGSVILGDVVYTSSNVITLSFSAAFAGKAYLR